MPRRLLIASLPVLALAAVLVLVLGSRHGKPRPQPAVAEALAQPKPKRHGAATTKLPAAPEQVRGPAARHMAIPILMYHVVANPPAGVPNIGLWVTPTAFAQQMAALKHAGYWAIPLAQAWRAWTDGGPLPRKPVVISFDDGYLGDYTHARPVLRRLGWPGVLNLELHNVSPGDLSARQVRALVRGGWEIDSHTLTHPDLTTVAAAQLTRELVGSQREIRRRFGVPASFFCYPYGHFNATVEAAVKAAGYKAATTEIEGYATAASNPFALPRVRVQNSDTSASLLAKLAAEKPLH